MFYQAIPISGDWSIGDAQIGDREILCVCANLAEIEPPFLAIAETCLSGEELTYANSFLKNADRIRYVLSHFLLNQLLIATFGANSTQVRSDDNKPCLLHNLGEFNISHSDSYFVAAFSTRPVGIDIEHIQPLTELEQMERLVFHPQEVLEISQMNQNEALVAFFRCWTRKEALLKLIGIGLNVELSDYYVSSDTRTPTAPSILGKKNQNYAIQDLGIADQAYLSSVAFERPETTVRFKRLSQESIRNLLRYCSQIT